MSQDLLLRQNDLEKLQEQKQKGENLNHSFDSFESEVSHTQDDTYALTDNFSDSESEIDVTETVSLVNQVAGTISQLVQTNNSQPLNKSRTLYQTIFHSILVPQISIQDYLDRIQQYSGIEDSTLIISLIYLDRLVQKNIIITQHNVHKLLFGSILLSIKYNEDQTYKNNYYARIAGVPMKDLAKMEYEFLLLLDFNLFVEESLFEKYKHGLQLN